jgi:leucyl aminopeptidase
MKIAVKSGKIDTIKTELTILGRFEDEKSMTQALTRLDKSLKGIVKESIDSKEFKGKPNEILLLHTIGMLPSRRLMLVGLGKKDEFRLDTLRKAMASAARKGKAIHVKSITIGLEIDRIRDHPVEDLARAVVEGLVLGLYRFGDYSAEEENAGEVKSIQIIVEDPKSLRAARKGVGVGQIVAESVNLTRDLNNTPGNRATPGYLAGKARSIARRHGLTCTVMNHRELEKRKMGAILAVGGGSDRKPRLIVLQHKGGGRAGEKIVLVGKGVTFDSGGISIKPGAEMDKMKYDKSGAVVVMGVMSAVARLGIPLNVIGIIPAAENLPSGTAYRPGDILKTYSGKTVEVINTDAEGRLIMADALSFGLKYKPAAMIDIATLTGACVIALGSVAAGLMGNNDDLQAELVGSGERTGERVWRLPLWDEYREFLKSEHAEIKNVGGREGSVITAGKFLQEFVEDVPWAHLDIAGTSWSDKGGPYIPKGSTGMGVRLLVDFLENRAAKPAGKGRKGGRR